MSIVVIPDGVGSALGIQDVQDMAIRLGLGSMSEKDAKDYLTILRSFEAIMKQIEQAPDYTPLELQPAGPPERIEFWPPAAENNPFNAWSHQCHIQSTSPSGDQLKGRTIAIKDNISVRGLPTTMGAPESLFQNGHSIASINATVVTRILDAGGIIKGTSTCESFCASPLSFTSATGPVHNPLLHNYTAGGSSSGSAVLVAANRLQYTRKGPFGQTAELAIGSDQAGSVRNPASYNGIYGLKPTFGLVPYTGAASMSPMIDHIGPLGATLEDIAALLEVMAGYDGFDPRMTPESPLRHQVKPYLENLIDLRQKFLSQSFPGQNMRVGLLKESFTMTGVSDEVTKTIYQTVNEFFGATGASVTEISIPMHQQGPAIWTAATRPSMSSHLYQGNPSGHLSYLPGHIRTKWPLTSATYQTLTSNNPAVVNIMFSELYAKEWAPQGLEAKAHRMVFELREAYNRALDEVDVLITPCAPTPAMPHSEESDKASIMERLSPAVGVTSNTCPFNVTGHPCLSVPCGFATNLHGPDIPLPVGFQIIGPRWADEQVIAAAALYERGREMIKAGATQGPPSFT
ncbi:hypothetical protein NW762_011034 [Fusarium torreyae]|uniref:Amidase domain-containing protein n=1 Tax=Fusarium torreyae TaxID=1237075 RepID=A0A9W8RSS1_9HYPO|nr:hypothetical protein NW762_011034 [Fusarium torreyae]